MSFLLAAPWPPLPANCARGAACTVCPTPTRFSRGPRTEHATAFTPSDKAAYLIALVHYATLYHADPRGLPHRLQRADGSAADAPAPEVAALMQQVAWDVVRRTRATGVSQNAGDS